MLNFIVNPRSGKGRGKKVLNKIISYCNDNHIAYSVHLTDMAGKAKAIADKLSKDGAENIIAVGGDGTFHEVLNGITEPEKITVGFIPAGRGNDYMRAAKLSLDPVTALKDILRGETVNLDYFTVGQIRCLNVAGCGLDVDVLKRVKGKTDKISYLVSLIYCLKHFEPFKLKIISGENVTDDEFIMVGICNGIAFGGGMKISPHSALDDGKLNVIAIKVPSDGKLTKAMTKFVKGNHIGMEYTSHFLCDEVKVEMKELTTLQIDGELYDNVDFDCKIVKGGLRTFKVSNS